MHTLARHRSCTRLATLRCHRRRRTHVQLGPGDPLEPVTVPPRLPVGAIGPSTGSTDAPVPPLAPQLWGPPGPPRSMHPTRFPCPSAPTPAPDGTASPRRTWGPSGQAFVPPRRVGRLPHPLCPHGHGEPRPDPLSVVSMHSRLAGTPTPYVATPLSGSNSAAPLRPYAPRRTSLPPSESQAVLTALGQGDRLMGLLRPVAAPAPPPLDLGWPRLWQHIRSQEARLLTCSPA